MGDNLAKQSKHTYLICINLMGLFFLFSPMANFVTYVLQFSPFRAYATILLLAFVLLPALMHFLTLLFF